ncbi:MAG: hypothetical protein QOH58_3239 [Thermoleophilaceae bacterium]|jgi:plastocyanin|nr:hypothetical protein [Thermoleophilaceae bacterium]
MRLNRLLLAPLTLVVVLATAAPAMAADWSVGVADFEFTPPAYKIAVGDRVVWNFSNGGHSATSVRGQAESWDSDILDAGATFDKTFTKPGRFQYVCTPHEGFMRGVIQVGEDAVRDTVDAFRTSRSGNKATVSFTLNEAAKATYALKGPSSRTVTRRRLAEGDRTLTLKRLKKGRYTGTLTLVDDFDKRVTQKKSFRIR